MGISTSGRNKIRTDYCWKSVLQNYTHSEVGQKPGSEASKSLETDFSSVSSYVTSFENHLQHMWSLTRPATPVFFPTSRRPSTQSLERWVSNILKPEQMKPVLTSQIYWYERDTYLSKHQDRLLKNPQKQNIIYGFRKPLNHFHSSQFFIFDSQIKNIARSWDN